MELIGSISKYLGFLSSNTRSKIQAIVDLALDYDQFIEALLHVAAESDAAEDLVDFACIVSYSRGFDSLVRKVALAHPNAGAAGIFTMEMDLTLGSLDDWESLTTATEDMVERGLEPWIEFHLRLIIWQASLGLTIASPNEEAAIARMEKLLEEDQRLEVFRATLHRMNAYRYRAEGSEEKGIQEFEEGLRLAEEIDDRILAAAIHASLAFSKRNFNMADAMHHAERALKLDPKIQGIAMVYLYTVRGEYSHSLEFYHDSIEAMEAKHTSPHYGSVPLILSHIYLEIGCPQDALEWANMGAEKGFFPGVDPAAHSTHLNLANALALLGRISEAEEHLSFANREALKKGAELHIGEAHYTTGLIEMSKGNLESAIWSFEQALNILRRIPRQTRVNVCLRRLAEAQAALVNLEGDTGETSWLSTYEDMARERDFPGHIGLALLIKAELRLKQNRVTEAEEILREAVEISKRRGTRFLQKLIANLPKSPVMM